MSAMLLMSSVVSWQRFELFHVAALSVVLSKAGTPRPSQGPIKGGSSWDLPKLALTAPALSARYLAGPISVHRDAAVQSSNQ